MLEVIGSNGTAYVTDDKVLRQCKRILFGDDDVYKGYTKSSVLCELLAEVSVLPCMVSRAGLHFTLTYGNPIYLMTITADLLRTEPARQCWCGCVAGKPWMGLA